MVNPSFTITKKEILRDSPIKILGKWCYISHQKVTTTQLFLTFLDQSGKNPSLNVLIFHSSFSPQDCLGENFSW